MTEFERWLVRFVDSLERKRKSSDRVYSMVYTCGHELMLEVLRVYRKLKD